MTEHGAKEDLEATITAYVIKRSPHNIGSLVLVAFDRSAQARQAVDEHFRCTGSARGEKHPFGWVTISFHKVRWRDHRSHRGVHGNPNMTSGGRIVIGDDRIHATLVDHRGQMFARH